MTLLSRDLVRPERTRLQYLALGGVPASGKSTLVRSLIERIYRDDYPTRLKMGLSEGLLFEKLGLFVLGVWPSEHTFPGTDRLSMACQPDVLTHLEVLFNRTIPPDGLSVLAEGDRLYNRTMLEKVAAFEEVTVRNLVVSATSASLARRHRARNDDQSASFLKGRETKVRGVCAHWTPEILVNETKNDHQEAVRYLLASVK